MVSALFGRELGAGLILNEITKDRLLSLEFPRSVAGVDPVQDIVLLVLGLHFV